KPLPIRIDELTAGLLDVRFEVGGDEAGLLLLCERESLEGTRRLLGRATPFVGRERELSHVLGALEECFADDAPRAVLVTGESGGGKPRLWQELLSRVGARGRSVEVLASRAELMSVGSPFGLLGSGLRGIAGILRGEPLTVRQKKLRARIGRH